MENYTIGFDIGIGSIGSAIIDDQDQIQYMGVRMFNTAKEAKEARVNRSARRNNARKKWRKKQLKNAFIDFHILDRNELEIPGYLCYTTKNEYVEPPKDNTIYHLRKRGLTEKLTKREILLCLYHLLDARGHFLMETVNFENDTIDFNEFEEKFFLMIEKFTEISDLQKKAISDAILKRIFVGKISASDLKNIIKEISTPLGDQQDIILNVVKLLCGYKADLKAINEDILFDTSKSVTIQILKSQDELIDPFLNEIVLLYDMVKISQILKDNQYLCQAIVKDIDEYNEITAKYSKDSEEYKELLKKIKDVKRGDGPHYRVVRNLANNYPNGLYVKECSAILRKQSEYYPEIQPLFIEVCTSIISARIPYNIGPMNENAKNAWIVKKNQDSLKYSYQYAEKNQDIVDMEQSIKQWKLRMISRCSYLPQEYALPKGSFIAETFNIVNELNILKAEKDGSYYLTYEDKVKVFDELFLNQKDIQGKITYKAVKELLGLEYYGIRKNADSQKKFNNQYTLYYRISDLIPELKINSIEEIFSNPKKIEKLEEIILHINLYNEEKSKLDYFIKEKYEIRIAKALSKLSSNSFFAFSKKFIMDTPMNRNGDSLLTLLFEDNTSSFTNEQMTRITNAEDQNGNPIEFTANKYEEIIRNNGGVLDYHILVSDRGVPVIPISRPVLRALNECIKVYNTMIRYYGVPKRIVIETARDFLASSEERKKKNVKSVDIKTRLKNIYDSLTNQIKENKNKKSYLADAYIESWTDIEPLLNGKNLAKIELYILQMGIDLYTGKPIRLNELDMYEIDHILPRGFGDDSMDNKVLTSRTANGKKGNRLPLQFLSDVSIISEKQFIETSAYIKHINRLDEMKLLSDKKKKMLLLENEKELEGFIEQNLVDTRYIIREFMAILRAYQKIHGYDTHIVALKSAYTTIYRNALGIYKRRHLGDQHHAHDAAILVIADRILNKIYPNYDRYKQTTKNTDNPFATYHGFMQKMADDLAENNQEDIKNFIIYSYNKTFGHFPSGKQSLVSRIKDYVPFYSIKQEKNYKGQFFKLTLLKQKLFDSKNVLAILGVNTQKHIFKEVYLSAIDFYKYTDKKGKKKHVAIHIPKVIVNSNGEIDKEKYLLLIKDYYKVPELIDDEGNLKDYFFRFRANINDIIYDTNMNLPLKLIGGSIAHRSLSWHLMNIFSYNQIDLLGDQICESIKNHLNIKGCKPDSLIDEIVDHVKEQFWSNIDTNAIDIKGLKDKLIIEKSYKSLSNTLAYYTYIFSYGPISSELDKYISLSINYSKSMKYSSILSMPNAQYIKLQSSVLGLRFKKQYNGTLIIESPVYFDSQTGEEKCNLFSKIKKEKFTWQIQKDVI